jgi:hypothetical protein
VPGFVSELHSTIGAYLDGSIDDLGAAVSDITPGEAGENATDGETADGDESEQSEESEA